MTRTTALENIKALLLEADTIDQEIADSLTEYTVLMPDLIDSLDSVELVMGIEAQLEVVIPDEDVNQIYDKGGKMCHVIDLYLSHANKTAIVG
jgi:acyl carrier protein